MTRMFRQAELLKAVSEWVRLGYVVEVTAEGIKVMPKGAEKSPDDLHALRYRGVMDLAFGGASDEEIGSISGHESEEMIRKYAGDARQIMLAKSANKKREA